MLSAVSNGFRLARAAFVMAREGVFATVDASLAPPPARLPLRLARMIARRDTRNRAERISMALMRLGPSYVKFGQFLATRPDIVGQDVARDLERLQDRLAPFPLAEAKAIITANLGQDCDQIFAELSEPVAAASIAQVHKAVIADSSGGQVMAVKVLRPGVEKRFRRDLGHFYFAARLADRFAPEAKRLRPVEIVDVLAQSVAIEMDLRLEAAALSEMAENTKGDKGFRVPKPDWERTAKDVLTMQWIDGISLHDQARIAAAGHDPVALGRNVIQSFLRHAMRDGFFHADMHQGNLMIDPEGNLVAVDFGIMGRLGLKERRFLAEILYGFITRDYRRTAEVHFEAGYVPARHSVEAFAQAIRAIGEPIHDRTADQISMAKLLTLLFEVTEIFDMQTRPELVLLQKTMVVVEGVARGLDPKLDMWKTAEPVVREWIEQHLGAAGMLAEAGGGVAALGRAAMKIPSLVERGERLVSELERTAGQGVTLSPQSIDAIGKAEARRARWGNLALWAIAAILAAWWFAG